MSEIEIDTFKRDTVERKGQPQWKDKSVTFDEKCCIHSTWWVLLVLSIVAIVVSVGVGISAGIPLVEEGNEIKQAWTLCDEQQTRLRTLQDRADELKNRLDLKEQAANSKGPSDAEKIERKNLILEIKREVVMQQNETHQTATKM